MFEFDKYLDGLAKGTMSVCDIPRHVLEDESFQNVILENFPRLVSELPRELKTKGHYVRAIVYAMQSDMSDGQKEEIVDGILSSYSVFSKTH